MTLTDELDDMGTFDLEDDDNKDDDDDSVREGGDEACLGGGDDDREEDDDDDEGSSMRTSAARNRSVVIDRLKIRPVLSDLYQLRDPEICPVTKSVETGFRPVWDLWAAFQKTKNPKTDPWVPKYGLNLYNAEATDIQKDYDRARVREFTMWLRESGVVTQSKLSKIQGFLNANLKCEFYNRSADNNVEWDIPKKGGVGIGCTTIFQNFSGSIHRARHAKTLQECPDILADVDNSISKTEARTLMLYPFEPKRRGKFDKCCSLYQITFAASFALSSQNVRRGEEQRSQKLVHRFTRRIEAIGPRPGTLTSMVLTNKAKHNQVGRLEYVGMVTHLDMLLDCAAWAGLLFLYRFVSLHEAFPTFDKIGTEKEDFQKLFSIPMFRSEVEVSEISSRYYGKIWKKAFSDAGILSDKVTHQTRRQAIQELNNNGCSDGDIHRMSGHKTASSGVGGAGRPLASQISKACNESYLTHPPVGPLTERAGGDPRSPRNHCPSWTTVDPTYLVNMIVPELVIMKGKLDRDWDDCRSYKERQNKRLSTRRNALQSILNDIGRALQMLASRPIDPVTGELMRDSPTLIEMYRHKNLSDLLNHPLFNSNEFQLFQERQRAAQDRHFQMSIQLNATGNYLLDRNFLLLNSQGERITQQLHGVSQQLDNIQKLLVLQVRDGSREPKSAYLHGGTMNNEPSPPLMPPGDGDDVNDLEVVDGEPDPPRKKRKAKSQQSYERELRRNNQVNLQVDRPILTDKGCSTISDHFFLYTNTWKRYEDKCDGGDEWRTDGFDHEKKQKVSNAKANWWSKRKCMYDMFRVWKFVDGLPDDECIARAEAAIATVEEKNGKRKKDEIFKAFSPIWLERFGNITAGSGTSSARRVCGRPKGRKTNKKSRVPPGAFAREFNNLLTPEEEIAIEKERVAQMTEEEQAEYDQQKAVQKDLAKVSTARRLTELQKSRENEARAALLRNSHRIDHGCFFNPSYIINFSHQQLQALNPPHFTIAADHTNEPEWRRLHRERKQQLEWYQRAEQEAIDNASQQLRAASHGTQV